MISLVIIVEVAEGKADLFAEYIAKKSPVLGEVIFP
jgi:hypothetical protein